MGGLIGAIIARFLTTKYDKKLSGKTREFYKKGILVGKQQYLIVKPLNAITLFLALYVLLFQQQTLAWLIQTCFVIMSVFFICIEKPKAALLFHVLILVYPFWQKLLLSDMAGIIMIITLFNLLFDISLMENLKNTLKYGGITQIEREKIKEYLEEGKKL